MQELQCADCIMNFLETEQEAHVREYIFELLFDDIHQVSTKYILQLLLSYAISLEAQKTLECISKWIIINIGNEIIQNIFDQLIREHFLLSNESELQNSQYLINLALISPLFASLFMTIVLDMLPNNLITNQDKCLRKLFNLFEAWIEKSPLIPIIAFKANSSHTMQSMFNPLPGLIYLTVLYPMKHLDRQADLDELISKIQFTTLRLIKDIAKALEGPFKSVAAVSEFKLLNLKQLESIAKRFEELSLNMDRANLDSVREQCLDRLAQIIQVSLQYGFTNCKRHEIKNLFLNPCFNVVNPVDNINMLTIVLNAD